MDGGEDLKKPSKIMEFEPDNKHIPMPQVYGNEINASGQLPHSSQPFEEEKVLDPHQR
jgi:hypothetical protein